MAEDTTYSKPREDEEVFDTLDEARAAARRRIAETGYRYRISATGDAPEEC